ncbi:MAG: hypothetical protein U9N14_07175 [Pseudomonadota bacterium]|nr:hypothetical protein [Pseudomonadota bacterium]
MPGLVGFSTLFLAIVANVTANILLAHAVRSPAFDGSWLDSAASLLSKPALWGGLAAAGILLTSYLFALRTTNPAFAYAFVTSLAMVGLSLTSWLFLGETLSLMSLAGIVTIMAGVALLALGS